jgi:branched-chain amino acid transport system permease protein
LGVTAIAFFVLWRIVRSPFGLAIQAIRDHPRRALSVGIDVRLHQLATFVLAGFFAGLAGALHAFEKGSVFPDFLFLTKSVEPFVMVLLGGMQVFLGPILGAGVYRLLETWVSFLRDYWSAVLGSILTLLVLLFPQGLVGALPARWRESRR